MVLASVPKPQRTVHDKKRQGQHHKATKHYTKTYWPYLPMLLVLVLGFFINTAWTAGSAVLGYATNVSPSSLLQETNIQRSENSRGALVLNNQLTQAAQAKANDMAAKNYWSHVAPDGTQPWQFISNSGYTYRAAGENLAYGFDTSDATVAGWMNSPGHRANILNGDYSEVGFGIANVPNYQGHGEQTVIVAMYGQPQTIVTPNSALNGTAPVTARVAGPVPITQKQDTLTPVNQSQALNAREVARVDVLASGRASWAAIAVAVIAAMSIIIFFVKHARLWRRLIVKGEAFIIHHPVLDTVFVTIAVAGFILTRTTGFIH